MYKNLSKAAVLSLVLAWATMGMGGAVNPPLPLSSQCPSYYGDCETCQQDCLTYPQSTSCNGDLSCCENTYCVNNGCCTAQKDTTSSKSSHRPSSSAKRSATSRGM
jgi:hypothetical protein